MLLASFAVRFVSVLDERQCRLCAGLASLLCGRNGDQRAAAWLGLHLKTVAEGRRELVGDRLLPEHARHRGGGRKALATNPVLSTRLYAILEYGTVGSSMCDLRWIRRSVAKLASRLTADGFAISASTVRLWLESNGFSLRVNRNCLATTKRIDRDLRSSASPPRAKRTGRPAVSVDAKGTRLNNILFSI